MCFHHVLALFHILCLLLYFFRVPLLKVTSPHGDELCVKGKDMFKAFGRGEKMDAELMELILSYWKDDPIRRTAFESGKRVLLGPYFIPVRPIMLSHHLFPFSFDPSCLI